MMKRIPRIAGFLIVLFCLTVSLSFAGRDEIQLTNNDCDDFLGDVNIHGHVVWWKYCESYGAEIFFYNGTSTVSLTPHDPTAWNPKINDSDHVVWSGNDGSDDEIFLYDGTSVIQITDNSTLDNTPEINNSDHLVWHGVKEGGGWEIFYYDGEDIHQLTENDFLDLTPSINDAGAVVWQGKHNDEDWEIFLYQGAGLPILQMTDNSIDDQVPRINNDGDIVWKSGDSSVAQDILLYDGASTTQLSAGFDSDSPQINNTGDVAWMEYRDNALGDWDFEILLSKGTGTFRITDNSVDDRLRGLSDNGHIAYYRSDGHDTEIFLSIPNTVPAIEWAKTFGGMNTDMGQAIAQTDDGGYIVAGATYSFGAGDSDFWVIKLDGYGTSQWQRSYGGVSYDAATSIQQTADEGFIVGGKTESFGSDGDMWLLKLGADGAVQWQKHYGGSENDIATALQQTHDDGYIVAGKTESFGAGTRGDVWILKLDVDGNVGASYPGTWQKTYGTTGGGEYAASIIQTGDHGFVVAGTAYSSGTGDEDFWVMKLNANGNVGPSYPGTWQKTYGGTDIDIAASIQKTGDSGYIVAGYSFSFGLVGSSFDVWLVKLNSDGEITWQKTYGTAKDDYASSVHITGDGGYVVTGSSCGAGVGTPCDGWIMMLDALGNIVRQKTYGGVDVETTDTLVSIKQTSDDGFIAAGATQSFGFGDTDLWVLKLDPNGEIDDCSAIGDWSAVSSPTTVTAVDTSATLTDTVITANDTVATVHVVSAFERDGCNLLSDLISLPETGQTTNYYPGDDGELRAGVIWPSPRFWDNSNGTVTDRLTGLMWLKDANCAHTIGYDPDGSTVGSMQWTSTLDFVTAINDGSHTECSGGYRDWRVPNINEIESLANLGQSDLAAWLTGQGFEHVQSGSSGYWSSTTHDYYGDGALHLAMADGGFTWKLKTSSHFVWPVRAGPQDFPDPAYPANVWKTGQDTVYYSGDDGDLQYGIAWPVSRFSDHGNGTVTDNLTGLMWLLDADCFGATDFETTDDTIADFNVNPVGYACIEYTEDYDNWRLSNRKELSSLIDRSRGTPPLPEGHPFLNINPGAYRSSNTHAGTDWKDWQVDMYYYGMPTVSDRSAKPFWLVRGGYQCGMLPAKIDTTYFTTLQEACSAAENGVTILAHAATFGALDLNIPISVTIRGGYDCYYETNPAFSIIDGTLTVTSGSLTIENLEIQ